MSPQLRRASEVLPPAVLLTAALALAVEMSRDRFDAELAQLVGLLALFELVTSFVETLLVGRFGDPRAGRAAGFVAAGAALAGAAHLIAREWPGSVALGAPMLVAALVIQRFALCVADPGRDELARLRARALADDRFDSVRVMIGVLPFLALPWLGAALLGLVASLRPAYVAPGLFVACWSILLIAAAWRAWSPAFARRPRRVFVAAPWPWLAEWYELPSRQQHARAERREEEAAARKFERRRIRAEKRAALGQPPQES